MTGSTFVGRDREIGVLRAAADAAVAGHGQVVLLSGEPGIGKTRICEEVAAYAQEGRGRVLWGRCYEGEGAPPYWPWVQIIRSAAGNTPVNTLRTVLAASGLDLAQLVPELRDRVPDLAAAALPDGEHARERIFDSVGRFLTDLSQEQPLVAIIDDLQGADVSSALLVQFIAQSLAQQSVARLLLVVACRTAALTMQSRLGEVLAALAQPNGHEHLRLGGLSEPEVARFVEMVAGAEAQPDVVAQLHQVTEGNPLFLKEVVRLRAREGDWSGEQPGRPVPSTVTAVIGRRLAALSTPCRHLLAAAAVMGRSFRTAVLADVVAVDALGIALTQLLDEGVQHQIIGPTEVPDVYRFSHALMCETLYAEVPVADRQHLHRRVGEALERVPEVGELLTEVTHHFLAAGDAVDLRKAVVYAQRAAERAVTLLAYEEGVRLAEAGLAALDRLAEPADVIRCELLLTLAHAQKCVVDTATARGTYQQAVDVARRLGAAELLARAVLGTFWRTDTRDTNPESIRVLEDTISTLGNDDSVLRVKLLGQLANELYFKLETQPRAFDLSREAVAMARRLGDPEALSDSLGRWYRNCWRPDNLDERFAVANELLALGETLGHRNIAAQGSLLRVYCLLELGELSSMDQEIERYARCAEDLRIPSGLYLVPFLRAARALVCGQFADAERWAMEAMEIGQRAKEPDALPLFLVQMGRVNHALGRMTADVLMAGVAVGADYRWDWAPRSSQILFGIDLRLAEAREWYDEAATQDFLNVPMDTGRLNALSNLAYACAHFQDTRRARVLYGLLLPYKNRNLSHGYAYGSTGSGARYLGLLAATLSRSDEAAQHFEDAIAHNARMGARPFCARSQVEYARLLITRNAAGDTVKAAALVAAAIETARELGMVPLGTEAEALQVEIQQAAPHAPRGAGAVTVASAVPAPLSTPAASEPQPPSRRIFVGREREMAVLQAAVADVLDGRGRLVLVAGEPGIGKTRTAEEFANSVRQQGGRVLWGRCYEGEGAPAFWPWVEVLRAAVKDLDPEQLRAALGGAAEDLAQIVPGIREQLPDLPVLQPNESPAARFALFDGVTRFLGQVARHSPLVIVLDDLHGADASSLMLLEFLARSLREMPLLVLGTHRDVGVRSGHALTETLVDLAREPSTERVVLSGMSEGDVARFVELSTGIIPAPDLVTALHRHTEGNPLFVAEFVRVLAAEGRLDVDSVGVGLGLHLPAGVKAVISRRLALLSPTCQDLLRIAAVMGREFRFDVLDAGAQLGAGLAHGTLDEALAAGVVGPVPGMRGRYRFAHALIRETLYDDLPNNRRAELHRQVGEAFEQVADVEEHLAELAHHFFEAIQGGGTASSGSPSIKAVAYARRAADRALSLMAYEEAARLYQLAFDIVEKRPQRSPQDDGERCELLLNVAHAQNGTGQQDVSVQTYHRVAALARTLNRPDVIARAALGAGIVGSHAGAPEADIVRLLEEALDRLGEPDSALKAHVSARLAVAQLFGGLVDQARLLHLSEQAVAIARRVGDPRALADALRTRHWVLWGWWPNADERVAISEEALRLADASGDLGLIFQSRELRVRDLLEQGNMPELDREIQTYTLDAQRNRHPVHIALALNMAAMQALLRGHLADAERLAQEGFALYEPLARETALQMLGLQLLSIRRAQGRIDDLEPTIRMIVERFPAAVAGRCALTTVLSDLDRAAEARSEFERLAADDFGQVPRNQTWVVNLTALASTCAFLGDVSRAQTLHDLLRPYAGRNVVMPAVFICSGAVSLRLGLLAATMQRWDDAVGYFEDALRMHRKMGAPLFTSETQHEYARMLLARAAPGDREQALDLLDSALTTAREMGFKSLEQKAATLRDAAPGTAARSTADPQPAERASGESPTANVFRREGDYWTLAYDGRVVRLKDSKGLQYLAYLLQRPGQEIHARDLVQQVGGVGDDGAQGHTQKPQNRIKGRPTEPLLDAKAKAAYRQRLEDLRDTLAEAEERNDLGRAARAREEIETISESLAAAVGLHGRDRVAATDSERARLTVTKGIKTAIQKLRSVHPSLAHHLATTVTTGAYCNYTHEHPAKSAWLF